MKLGCTYIKVGNMEKSIEFHSKLLEMEPTFQNKKRWVMFECGNTLALYNKQYDINVIENNQDLDTHYNDIYIKYLSTEKVGCSKSVVFNFKVDNLQKEYKRIKKLNIGAVSDIMYVNIIMPYWFFIIEDPDGNEIEIEGYYNEDK